MVDTLIDISAEYQLLRRENPVACGEWLLTFSKQGLSQSQIAQKLGANRQVIGRYLRMGLWPKDLKELIFKHREQISNTDLIRAASSPKNEQFLKESIERKENNKKTHSQQDLDAEPPPLFQLPTQPPRCNNRDLSEWRNIKRYISSPSTVFLLISIMSLSAYLIHQGILFFSTVDNNNVSAISSAVVSELLPLVCAACFALSVSRMRRFLSGLLLTGSIIDLSLFMHAALSQKQVDTSANVSHLERQRANVLLSIDTLNAAAAALPANFASKKQSIIEQIDTKHSSLVSLDASIAQAAQKAASAGNVLLSYGV